MFALRLFRKILELEEELKVVGNNMKSLEISEQEVANGIIIFALCKRCLSFICNTSFPY